MLFTSYKFILFLLILFILYYAIPSKHQCKLLLIFSYAFYLFAGPKYIIYILVSSVTIHITEILINNITEFNYEEFKIKLIYFYTEFGNFDNGKASGKLYNVILDGTYDEY